MFWVRDSWQQLEHCPGWWPQLSWLLGRGSSVCYRWAVRTSNFQILSLFICHLFLVLIISIIKSWTNKPLIILLFPNYTVILTCCILIYWNFCFDFDYWWTYETYETPTYTDWKQKAFKTAFNYRIMHFGQNRQFWHKLFYSFNTIKVLKLSQDNTLDLRYYVC